MNINDIIKLSDTYKHICINYNLFNFIEKNIPKNVYLENFNFDRSYWLFGKSKLYIDDSVSFACFKIGLKDNTNSFKEQSWSPEFNISNFNIDEINKTLKLKAFW